MDAKAILDNLQSLGFTPGLAKPEMVEQFERRRARSNDDRAK